jgi:subtilisin family serine protease
MKKCPKLPTISNWYSSMLKTLRLAIILLLVHLPSFNLPPSRPVPLSVQAHISQPEHIHLTQVETMSHLAPDLRMAAVRVQTNPTENRTLVVTALVDPPAGPAAAALLRYPALSREVAGMRWVTGEIDLLHVPKLAALPGVLSVTSVETFSTAEAPGLDRLRTVSPLPDARPAVQLAARGNVRALRAYLEAQSAKLDLRRPDLPQSRSEPSSAPLLGSQAAPLNPPEVHGAAESRALGITGAGVTVAVVDTGVDFGHPDLTGTQAQVAAGSYAGWSFAYDTISGYLYTARQGYAVDPLANAGRIGNSNYAAALPVEGAVCAAGFCTAQLPFGETKLPIALSWPDLSLSGDYLYTVLPDAALIWQTYYSGLGYPGGLFIPPLIIVSDENEAGVYDAVYVDLDYDGHLTSTERMSKQNPAMGIDLTGDGAWDLSAGLLAWISDGVNQPPGVVQLYPAAAALPVPPSGRLLAFINDTSGHGTSCAGQIAAQGVILDPSRLGPAASGIDSPVLAGIAPQARIAAFQNGFELPFDAWTLAVLGFDGLPESGDEVQLVSNSWGASGEIADGWDETSRFIHALNLIPDEQTGLPLAGSIMFLAATGNGGHGYATVTSPGGATILDVGASTLYGNLSVFENVTPERILQGEIQPWSNRGPGGLGDLAPDIAAVGAYGTGAVPLNLFVLPDGQSAYDVFGGTSMSTPLTAGGAALVYQAFRLHHARWPSWKEARSLLLGGAVELGYEPSVQGAGLLRVDRSVAAALDLAPRLDPPEWAAGAYHGEYYSTFPRILNPGQTDTQRFVLSNPEVQPISLAPSAVRLARVYETVLTIPYVPPPEGHQTKLPIYLRELNALVQAHPADLIRAQLILPYSAFDADEDYYADQWWSLGLYDWTDIDGDGVLWVDVNHDGQTQPDELDGAAPGQVAELNRFSFSDSLGTVLETSLGHMGLAQRHDGLYLGLGCIFCGESTTLQVRIVFYRYQPWDWLTLTPAQVEAPAGGQAVIDAEMRVPLTAQAGYYEGFIRTALAGHEVALPVTVQVAAPAGPIEVLPGGDAPYANANLQGGFNWYWREEAGDWRLFYLDLPASPAELITRGVVDLSWASARSDIDTFVFAPAEDTLTRAYPDLFGPSGLRQATASNAAFINAGKFRRETVTGGPREVLSFEPEHGLHLLAIHQVLSGGEQPAEPLRLSYYTLGASAGSLPWIEPLRHDSEGQAFFSASRSIRIVSDGDIPDGLRLSAYGFSLPIEMKGLRAAKNDSYDLCSLSWIYQPGGGLELSGAGLLDISAVSPDPTVDLDILVLRDDGDNRYECNQDPLAYYSIDPGPSDELRVTFPHDGVYWVGVQGYIVPSYGADFDITIRAAQGAGMRLAGAPVGAVSAGQGFDVEVDILQPYPEGGGDILEGIVYLGLPSVPGLVEIPVSLRPAVLLQPPARLSAASPSVFTDPVEVRLEITNSGALAEMGKVVIQLPPGLVYVITSATAPGSPPVYDPSSHTLTWEGALPGDDTVRILFAVTGNPLAVPGPVTLSARVEGLGSGQVSTPSLLLQLNRWLQIFPLIAR